MFISKSLWTGINLSAASSSGDAQVLVYNLSFQSLNREIIARKLFFIFLQMQKNECLLSLLKKIKTFPYNIFATSAIYF